MDAQLWNARPKYPTGFYRPDKYPSLHAGKTGGRPPKWSHAYFLSEVAGKRGNSVAHIDEHGFTSDQRSIHYTSHASIEDASLEKIESEDMKFWNGYSKVNADYLLKRKIWLTNQLDRSECALEIHHLKEKLLAIAPTPSDETKFGTSVTAKWGPEAMGADLDARDQLFSFTLPTDLSITAADVSRFGDFTKGQLQHLIITERLRVVTDIHASAEITG